MIRSVHIENYGCIERLDVALSPLTVFVGPNASGKSTLLEALSSRPEERVPRGKTDAGPVSQLTDKQRETVQWGPPGLIDAANLSIHFEVDALRRAELVEAASLPARSGKNLVNVLATLPRRVKEQIATDFCHLVPVFRDVDVRPLRGGQVHVVFEDRRRPGEWFSPSEVSDGSLLVLAYLTLLHLDPAPQVLRIEEPEHGLHPYLVQELVSLFRKMSRGELATDRPPVQVIVATHSATLLDALEPEEVRFMTRLASGQVRVDAAPTDRDDWRDAYDDYERSLGGMWLAGGLGAVPGQQ